MRVRRLVVVVACALALLAVPVSASSAATFSATNTPAPKLSNPTATATKLVSRFFTLIQQHDVAGLKKFVSPAFQLERADGSGMGKPAYLAALPTLSSFELTDLTASQAGTVLVARYLATATGVVNGKPYTPGPAPRLTVFVWNGSAWQIAAHANFNPLTG